jgi:hypothetical protein
MPLLTSSLVIIYFISEKQPAPAFAVGAAVKISFSYAQFQIVSPASVAAAARICCDKRATCPKSNANAPMPESRSSN